VKTRPSPYRIPDADTPPLPPEAHPTPAQEKSE
jgi:hypothetical protein